MAKRKDFDLILRRLSKGQLYWIRRTVGIHPGGPAPSLTKKKRKDYIEWLENIALDMNIRKLARREFREGADQKRSWHNTRSKGFGRDAKKRHFAGWFDRNIGYKSCIYVFWAGKRCRYVGRTVHGKGRPQAHFVKHWFGGVTRIDVYAVRRGSLIPKLECLAIHRWNPSYTKYKAASKKWTKKCPICEMLKDLRAETVRAFPLRRKKNRRRKKRKSAKMVKAGKRAAAARKTAGKNISLKGILKSKSLRRKYKGKMYYCWVLPSGRIKHDGKIYDTPSAAGRAVRGKTTNGWNFWRYKRAKGQWVLLGELRR